MSTTRWLLFLILLLGSLLHAQSPPRTLRAGIIGLDTSHVIAFTKVLNDPNAQPDVSHCRVVAAYPKGSSDIESSVSRIPRYTAEIQKLGVEITGSINELLTKVDVVLLETNDGRPHLKQAMAVIKAGKPLFIDKPLAASLAEAIAIFEAASRHKVPIFSSSSLRYAEGVQEISQGSIGQVQGADTYSPASIEKTHPDLFWYGIHGVEMLYTIMGPGCERVVRVNTQEEWTDWNVPGHSRRLTELRGDSLRLGNQQANRPLPRISSSTGRDCKVLSYWRGTGGPC